LCPQRATNSAQKESLRIK